MVVDIIIVQCDVVCIVGVVLVDFQVVVGWVVCWILSVGSLLLVNDFVVQCLVCWGDSVVLVLCWGGVEVWVVGWVMVDVGEYEWVLVENLLLCKIV